MGIYTKTHTHRNKTCDQFAHAVNAKMSLIISRLQVSSSKQDGLYCILIKKYAVFTKTLHCCRGVDKTTEMKCSRLLYRLFRTLLLGRRHAKGRLIVTGSHD